MAEANAMDKLASVLIYRGDRTSLRRLCNVEWPDAITYSAKRPAPKTKQVRSTISSSTTVPLIVLWGDMMAQLTE